MIPMLPLCSPQAMFMPMCPAMMPMGASSPFACAPNMFSTTSILNEYDSQMYGRFQHVEREHPNYRHAPFDWYRPPKQCYNIVHEDAAVVTLDGPVPIGDFYRYYIYGDDYDDDDDDYDDDGSSYGTEDYDDVAEPSYEPRSIGYRRDPQRDVDLDDEDIDERLPSNRSSSATGNYTTLNRSRAAYNPRNPARSSTYQRNRTVAGDDFDDALSDNSTYAN